jgi:hypothetical protein
MLRRCLLCSEHNLHNMTSRNSLFTYIIFSQKAELLQWATFVLIFVIRFPHSYTLVHYNVTTVYFGVANPQLCRLCGNTGHPEWFIDLPFWQRNQVIIRVWDSTMSLKAEPVSRGLVFFGKGGTLHGPLAGTADRKPWCQMFTVGSSFVTVISSWLIFKMPGENSCLLI